jgi:hypothetical protein
MSNLATPLVPFLKYGKSQTASFCGIILKKNTQVNQKDFSYLMSLRLHGKMIMGLIFRKYFVVVRDGQKCLMGEIVGYVICGLGTCTTASGGLVSTAERNVVYIDTL